jgi:hypothetical protein
LAAPRFRNPAYVVIAGAVGVTLIGVVGLVALSERSSQEPPQSGEASVPAEESVQPDTALEHIRAGGDVRVAVGTDMPYGDVDYQGEGSGFYADLAQEVFTELGADAVELEWVASSTGSRMAERFEYGLFDAAVVDGDYAQACSQRTIAPGAPTTARLEAFLVPDGNPEGIEDYTSFAESGLTPGSHHIDSRREAAEADGLADDQWVDGSLDQVPELLDDGVIDGHLGDSVWLRWHLSEDRRLGELAVTAPFPGRGEPPS